MNLERTITSTLSALDVIVGREGRTVDVNCHGRLYAGAPTVAGNCQL